MNWGRLESKDFPESENQALKERRASVEKLERQVRLDLQDRRPPVRPGSRDLVENRETSPL